MDTVFYIGPSGLSASGPGVHALHMARLMRSCGKRVRLICEQEGDAALSQGKTQEFPYTFWKKPRWKGKLGTAAWLFEQMFGGRAMAAVRLAALREKPQAIVLYSRNYGLGRRLLRYCRKNNIRLVYEIVDWFEPKDACDALDRLLIRRADKKARRLNVQAKNVLVISRYLEQYYKAQGCHVLFVPPVFSLQPDREITRHPDAAGAKLRLVYAGSLGGGKDLLDPVLQALRRLNQETVRVSLDLIGPSEKELAGALPGVSPARIGIRAHGRLPHAQAVAQIAQADFGVLLRENEQYAKAGFSTKFAEAMSLGVPMICTKVGGADSVVTDGVDGVLLADNSEDTVRQTLERLLGYADAEILNMKKSAYQTALAIFDEQAHVAPMQEFLSSLR